MAVAADTEGGAEAMVDVEEEQPQQTFAMDILLTISTAQNQNGLRHSDYQRYRQYCSRRLRRVRKSVGLSHAKKCDKKETWKAKNVEKVTDARMISIPLLNAERAWAYAMQLKSDMEEDGDRKRFHLLKRFKRAAQYSQELADLCAVAADRRTQLEADAYNALMHGNLYLQRDQAEVALEKFMHAKMAYEQLAKISGAEIRTLCAAKLSSIEPGIRYCKYVLNRQQGKGADTALLQGIAQGEFGDLLKSKVASIIAETAQDSSLDSVSWRGIELPVTNERCRVGLVSARAGSERLANTDDGEARQQLYQEVLSKYEEAASAIRGDMRVAEQERKKSSRAEIQLNQLRLLRDYISFAKLNITREKMLNLAWDVAAKLKAQGDNADTTTVTGKVVKPDDIVHLFERLLESVAEQGALLNAANGAVAVTEKDGSKVVESESLTTQKQQLEEEDTAFRAFRCFFLAESYWRFGKHAEAAALYDRCSDRVLHALEDGSVDNPSLTMRLQTLKTDVATRQCVLQASSYIHSEMGVEGVGLRLSSTNLGSPKASSSTPSTLQTTTMFAKLDQYHVSDALVSFPPNFQATPCKPVLFDLAFNYVDATDVEISHRRRPGTKPTKPHATRQATVGSRGQQQAAEGKKEGWFGGWLG